MYIRVVLLLLVSYCILQAMADIDDGIKDIDTNNDGQVQAKFSEFKQKFNKSYASAEEEAQRLQIFKENLIQIQKMNANPDDGATYGINQFADMNSEEMKRRTGLIPPSRKK